MPDISASLAPKSNQLDNIDLRGDGHRIFTVTAVDYHPDADQPVIVHLAEFDRPWKPGKNMRRVLSHCWGKNSDDWPGHRVELYADEKVRFGNDTPGGTRISRVSGITKPTTAAIMLGQGKAGAYKVDPLPEAPKAAPEPTPLQLAQEVAKGITDATTEAEVREWGNRAHARNLLDFTPEGATETLRQLVTARLAELPTPADDVALNDPALDDQP